MAVIGGACFSGWRLYRRQGPAHLLLANALIATGTLLASLAGTLARLTSNSGWFWVLLASGFVVLFAGFLVTAARAGNRGRRLSATLAPAGSTHPQRHEGGA